MTLIPGASRFLNSATLSNQQGFAAQTSDILQQSVGSASLLDAGRNLAVDGVGLSSRARLLNQQFLSQSSGTYNTLFSTSGGGSATVEAARTQILGLQSSVPVSRATPELRQEVAELVEQQNAEAGSIIDETV